MLCSKNNIDMRKTHNHEDKLGCALVTCKVIEQTLSSEHLIDLKEKRRYIYIQNKSYMNAIIWRDMQILIM